MKKLTFLSFPLLLLLVMFSCNKESIETPAVDDVQLRAGTWTVDHVEANYFDNGYLVNTEYVAFGEDTEGGICTFDYDTETWTMVDNGETSEFSYRIEDRVIYTAGGGTWGVRELTEDRLEMTLRGEETSNPCQFSTAGTVYYLTRNAATKQ